MSRPNVFSFSPRWKEELVVVHPHGTVVLEFSMGRPTACLPSEDRWQELAPPWARDWWPDLHEQLQRWCEGNRYALTVGDWAPVYSWSKN